MTTRRTRTGRESHLDANRIVPGSKISDGKRLGNVIRIYRTANPRESITQDAMAHRVGTTRNTILNFESGRTDYIRPTALNKFADGMGMTVQRLRELLKIADDESKLVKAISRHEDTADTNKLQAVAENLGIARGELARCAILYLATLSEPEMSRALKLGRQMLERSPADSRELF